MTSRPAPTFAARLRIGAAALAIAAFSGSAASLANEAPSEEEEQASTAVQTTPPDEPLPENIDWNALAVPLDRPYTPPPKLRTAPRDTSAAAAWSRSDRPNGTAAVSLKQPVSPFCDIKAGVDLDVATQTSPLRTPETLPDKLASDSRIETSKGAAWMSARAPGVPYLADHVALEARMNPQRDAKLGTGFSKSLPLYGDEVSLTLRHGYYVTQHDAIPGLPATAAHARTLEMDRSAQVSFTETGTSLVAGQTLSPSGDRWLNSIGAQQKLFDGLSITGSVSETRDGFSNKSLSAGFKKSW